MENTPVTLNKARISDRTESENRRLELLEHDAKIAHHNKQADIAAANGDIRKAQTHMTYVEIYTNTRSVIVRSNEEFEAKAKIMSSLPLLPADSLPKGIPFSQMTDNQRHALDMEAAAQRLRPTIDRKGAEGKYSVELAMMHTFLNWRDEAIKKDLGWKLHGGIYYPPIFARKTSSEHPSWFKRLFG